MIFTFPWIEYGRVKLAGQLTDSGGQAASQDVILVIRAVHSNLVNAHVHDLAL